MSTRAHLVEQRVMRWRLISLDSDTGQVKSATTSFHACNVLLQLSLPRVFISTRCWRVSLLSSPPLSPMLYGLGKTGLHEAGALPINVRTQRRTSDDRTLRAQRTTAAVAASVAPEASRNKGTRGG